MLAELPFIGVPISISPPPHHRTTKSLVQGEASGTGDKPAKPRKGRSRLVPSATEESSGTEAPDQLTTASEYEATDADRTDAEPTDAEPTDAEPTDGEVLPHSSILFFKIRIVVLKRHPTNNQTQLYCTNTPPPPPPSSPAATTTALEF